MDRTWIEDVIENMKGTSIEFKEGWGSMLYRLEGKMIGMRGSYKDGRPILTIKLPPEQGQILREVYEDIFPGYYSNKTHYNSIFLDAGFDREFITELLEDSWQCVFETLPKKTRAALGEPGE
jgi:predicted DNA-binding protein (MmcQ/YjbR family)